MTMIYLLSSSDEEIIKPYRISLVTLLTYYTLVKVDRKRKVKVSYVKQLTLHWSVTWGNNSKYLYFHCLIINNNEENKYSRSFP